MARLRSRLTLLAALYLLALGAFFGSAALGLQTTGLLALLGEVPLYLLLPLPCLIVAALLLRAHRAAFLALVPAVVLGFSYGPYWWPAAAAETTAPSLRVLTFNVGGVRRLDTPSPLVQAIQAEAADVVALQEVPWWIFAALKDALRGDYPYQAGWPDALTLSRLPILDAAYFRLSNDGYLCQRVDLAAGEGRIALFNVHVLRPTLEADKRQNLLRWATTYDPSWREPQLDTLLDQMHGVEGPLLLTGDFNQTEWSGAYRRLTAELQDSFRAAGAGPGHTFPSHWGPWRVPLPLVRIDYIFHSEEFVTIRSYVGPDAGSHHLPVAADLSYRSKSH
jgi:endonuclease/exonuclease/phosphatase (EEP) superfamily protein YafD